MSKIKLDDIAINGGTQPRAALNLEVVAEYAERYKEGDKFPPLTIYFDGKTNWLADGFHRFHSAKRAGMSDINVTVIDGTLRDAKFHAWKANRKHGQPLTNQDKRNIVLEILEDEETQNWSDSHIAKEFSFSQSFVSNVRKSLNSEISEIPAERTFINKHGQIKTMKVGNIGKTKSDEPDTGPTEAPEPAADTQAAPEPSAPPEPALASPEASADTQTPPPYEGPDEIEIAYAMAVQKADEESMQKLIAADDTLSAALTEITRLNAENATLRSRINGLMGEKNDAIKQVKKKEAQVKKLEKELKAALS